MQKAINLQGLSQQSVDSVNKRVQILLGCIPESKSPAKMDARAFYEDMLALNGKVLSQDGKVIDKKDAKWLK